MLCRFGGHKVKYKSIHLRFRSVYVAKENYAIASLLARKGRVIGKYVLMDMIWCSGEFV